MQTEDGTTMHEGREGFEQALVSEVKMYWERYAMPLPYNFLSRKFYRLAIKHGSLRPILAELELEKRLRTELSPKGKAAVFLYKEFVALEKSGDLITKLAELDSGSYVRRGRA